MSSSMRTLLATEESWSLLVIRLMLGIVFFAHGSQKLLGWFGGYGFSGTMGYFTQQIGVPAFIGFLVIMIEFFGSLALIVGFLARLAALGVTAVMLGAIFTVHIHNGFFMNWSGQQAGEGYEYHLLVLAMCLAIMIGGAGAASVDRALSRSR